MKALIMLVAGLATLAAASAVAANSAESVIGLQAKIDEAKRDVSHAHASLERAKTTAFRTMTPSDQDRWQQAEARFEDAETGDASPDQIADLKQAVEDVEARTMKDGARSAVDAARDKELAARDRLNQAKAQMAADTRGTNNHDESSQAIQPENRTQNGANFSIRSQRDSENHPPLPTSQ